MNPRPPVIQTQVGRHLPARQDIWHHHRAAATPARLPHAVQLCTHCQQNPAGFWVSRNNGQTVRRPWCLSCCQQLDPRSNHAIPFDG